MLKRKMQPPECLQDFPSIWPSDLLFDPTLNNIRTWLTHHQDKHSNKISNCWSKKGSFYSVNKISLQFDLDIIKTNILTTFQTAEAKIASYKVLTRFFPSIWPIDLLFDLTWPMFEHDLHITKTHLAFRVLTRFPFNLTSYGSVSKLSKFCWRWMFW